MSEKGLLIGGFLFSTNKEYSDAKQEQETIEYLKANSDLSKPKTVLKLYSKLTENRTFHTPIGYLFLKELQEIILNAGIVKLEELESIYIPTQNLSENEELNNLSLHHYKQIAEKAHIQNRNSRIINIFLAFIIIVMIAIAIYSDKSVYTDFENKVIDKYASWEEELNNREQDLNNREKLLNDAETNLNGETTNNN